MRPISYFRNICRSMNSAYEYLEEFKKGKKTIESVLKAFEIIKEKQVDVHTLFDFVRRLIKAENVVESYNIYVGHERALTIKEYELLKEALG